MKWTLTAAALTAATAAAPLTAWYLAGSREVRLQTRQMEEAAWESAQAEAERQAVRLGHMLERLRAAESRRPYYHYQNLFHDPRGAATGIALSRSPLASGPGDALVRAYFQIDAAGKLTLPTLNSELASLNSAATRAGQWPILDDLLPAAKALATALPLPVALPDQVAGEATPAAGGTAADSVRLEILAQSEWLQNQRANQYYREIQRVHGDATQQLGDSTALPPAPAPVHLPFADPPAPPLPEKIFIHISDFQWRTVTIGGAQGLVALRQVQSPDGLTTQGFQIDAQELAFRLTENGAGLVSLTPLGGELAPRIPMAGADWYVTAGTRVKQALSTDQLRQIAVLTNRFRRNFLLGLGGALLAGLLLVMMVFVTERAALQRSRFAAAAAHELRTPLTGLRMYGEMLAEGLGDPAQAQNYARQIAAEAERLGRVVGNVLEFTRLERGGIKVRPVSGDLRAAVTSLLGRLGPAFAAAGAPVEFSAPEALPAVRFDADAVGQIVQNLLDNAEKFSRGMENRTIQLSLGEADGGVQIVVEDHGPGIPAAQQRRLFKPFSRGTGADLPAGLGLGLAMVRQLALAQGGAIRHETPATGGARFVVTLPKG